MSNDKQTTGKYPDYLVEELIDKWNLVLSKEENVAESMYYRMLEPYFITLMKFRFNNF